MRCNPHQEGVAPGRPPFYEPGCEECERKRAAGLLTGSEPRPALFKARRNRYKVNARAFARLLANQKARGAWRRKHLTIPYAPEER